ncbi:MAG: photosystem II reaction center PsbP [Prochlorotrichaceae cyanobacterium]|jgi:photosystem II oxygen-evolving enhancer protein 2
MTFKPLKTLLLVLLAFGLLACASPVAGLKPFINPSGGYRFLYPNGWVQVKLTQLASPPDVVFRDLINETENVSVVISPLSSEDGSTPTLEALGTPGEVGYSLQQNAIAPPGSGRTAELVNATERTAGPKTYYILEYEVTLPGQRRHDLASVVVNRGNLYTFNASTTEDRWQKLADRFKTIVNSFTVDT